MNHSNRSTIEIPGVLLPALRSVNRDRPTISNVTIESISSPIRSVVHLLSGKPLRRPNRRRPLAASDEVTPEIRETYPHQERAALAAGWDDPELDIYAELAESGDQ